MKISESANQQKPMRLRMNSNRLIRRLGNEEIGRLERWIDEFSALYGLPRCFVVPGQSSGSAALHIARAVCRRCERMIVMLNRSTGGYDKLVVCSSKA